MRATYTPDWPCAKMLVPIRSPTPNSKSRLTTPSALPFKFCVKRAGVCLVLASFGPPRIRSLTRGRAISLIFLPFGRVIAPSSSCHRSILVWLMEPASITKNGPANRLRRCTWTLIVTSPKTFSEVSNRKSKASLSRLIKFVGSKLSAKDWISPTSGPACWLRRASKMPSTDAGVSPSPFWMVMKMSVRNS